MGVTAIRGFRNSTSATLFLQGWENRASATNRCLARPGTTRGLNMWIPWCDSADRFGAIIKGGPAGGLWQGDHVATIGPRESLPSTSDNGLDLIRTSWRYWIWQSGDEVRYSTDGQWHYDGEPVPGHPWVDGNRNLIVHPDGSLELQVVAY